MVHLGVRTFHEYFGLGPFARSKYKSHILYRDMKFHLFLDIVKRQ